MKLIVLIVVSFTVFMANCRERPDSRDLSNDVNNLSDGRNLPDDHNFSDGSDLSDSRDLYYGSDLSDGPNNETSTPESFSSDPMDIVFTTDVDEVFQTIEFGQRQVQGGFENYDSYVIDHQMKEDGRVQNERKLRGGSKCKSDIVCSLLGGSCVTNSTYCSGREVPSVCSGAKCKCCITVNLEVKVHDLETELRAMIVNITSANSNLNTKLDSMMNFMMSANSSQATVNSKMDLKIDSIMSTNSNLTIENSNMDLKIDSIMSNLTLANSNMDLKVDSIMSTNSNLTIANSNMDLKIDSAISNLTIANSNMDLKIVSIMSTNSNLTIANSGMKNELKLIKDDLTNANTNQNTKLNSIISSSSNLRSVLTNANANQDTKLNSIISSSSSLRNVLTNANTNQDSKLDSIMEHQGCPKGLFLFTPSNQCFRLLTDTKRNWFSAKSACRALGLELAQPYDPIGIQSYFVQRYGLTQSIWIDARGDGSNLRWQRNGRHAITSNSHLWWPGMPGSAVTPNNCLLLLAQESQRKQNPGLLYYNHACSGTKWPLCELVID